MNPAIKLQPELARSFEEMGFSEWTNIQNRCIPLIQQGKDVIGQSHTGSGKTVAFGFPLLEKVVHNQGIQALILVPTRELCEQVTSEMRKFSRYKKMSITAVYGGVAINPQISNLRHADIVVGTPGRILDHLQRGTLSLQKVRILVLDEADKMFEMGFIDDIRKIISQVPKDRQTLLFSATIPQQIHEIVVHYMKHPEKVKVQPYVDNSKLAQYFYNVESRDKFSLLVHILKHETKGLNIIFCATRSRVNVLGRNLNKQGIESLALHGGLTQNRRKQAIDMFHSNKADVLVASDVAARGLDIKNVGCIINYDIPKTSKEYIHRIGRTARAGSKGKVISLLSHQDHDNFRNVLEDRLIIVEQVKLPEFQRLPFSSTQHREFQKHRPWHRKPYESSQRDYKRHHSFGHTGSSSGFKSRPENEKGRFDSSRRHGYHNRRNIS